ncbi:MAG TPA: lipopolysaccharide kinase InaA family protein [Longimicrobiaceae bacterium]
MRWRAYLSDPALRDFEAIEVGGWRILVRSGFRSWAAGAAKGELDAAATIGGGRAEHPVFALPDGGEAVFRRFHRGGLMRHLNGDAYFAGHRAFAEARVTARAAAAGVRVPEVIAAGERRSGLAYRAWIATRRIARASGLEERLATAGAAGAERRSALLGAAGEQIGRMHDAGIIHPDLNLRNLLVVQDGDEALTVYIIDFDRAVLLPAAAPSRQRARELLRLARSAAKLGVPLRPEDWASLRAGYGPAWPADELPLP